MTPIRKQHIDLSKAVDPSNISHVPLEAWSMNRTGPKEKKAKSLPSPFNTHGKKGTIVILMAGALYMSTVLFMVFMAKAALG